MDLRSLRAFVVLAEERHFHRAAERLFVAQPALSQTIKRLEKQLHVELFTRTTRSVELTDPGRVLLGEARQVLAAADRALSAVQHAVSGELGTVRIGFVASAALGLVPTLLLAVQQRWPRLELELVEATTGEQLTALLSGQLDIGIAREAHPSPGLVITPLVEERLVAAVPTGHALADRGRVALRDLRDERFIVPPRGATPLLSDHISGLCAAAGFRQTVAHEALQFPTILGLVAANTGIAIVPEAMRVLRLPGLTYLDLHDRGATSRLSAITTTARSETALLSNVITAIEAAGNTSGRTPIQESNHGGPASTTSS
jgi:DNA-binding transcriptional LysR family regulator